MTLRDVYKHTGECVTSGITPAGGNVTDSDISVNNNLSSLRQCPIVDEKRSLKAMGYNGTQVC